MNSLKIFSTVYFLVKMECGKVSQSLVAASYEIAYVVAKQKESHTIAESFIKPCIEEMVEILIGKDERDKTSQISLSADTISNRIKDMSLDVLDQIIQEIKETTLPFAIQMDQRYGEDLIVFVRYICESENSIKEDFLFYESWTTSTKATDIYQLLDDFFTKNEVNWKTKIGFICCYSAPAMLGKKSEFVALVKAESPQVKIAGEDEEDAQNSKWIQNPFIADLELMKDNDELKEQLLDLKSKALLKDKFNPENLGEFWCSQRVDYPDLSKSALLKLIPFTTTYLCEAGFSTLVDILTNDINRLDVKDDMRLALSKTVPRISLLSSKMEQLPFH